MPAGRVKIIECMSFLIFYGCVVLVVLRSRAYFFLSEARADLSNFEFVQPCMKLSLLLYDRNNLSRESVPEISKSGAG